jgi:hypothetical protein
MTSSFFDLSPALKRYYRRSALPLAAWVLLVVARRPLLALSEGVAGKIALALLPLLGMAWICWEYMRFLRECDELERRIEQLAMAWSVATSLLAATAVLLLHDADAVRWSGVQVCAGLLLLQCATYMVVRWWLHWRYR